jgi:LysR family transcriptional activator of nhaA
MMNLKHLHYFWKTAKLGGVVKAGEALHITPQTISGQVRLLEESLDTELFARQGRGLELTDAGRLVMGYAEEMFSGAAPLPEGQADRIPRRCLGRAAKIAGLSSAATGGQSGRTGAHGLP